MSHFVLTVCLPGHLTRDAVEPALDSALARFDENRDVPRYLEYTRQELIAKGRGDIEQFRDTLYATYLADTPAYEARNEHNSAHLRYLAGTDGDGGFPARLSWSDEQVYAYETRHYAAENIGPGGEVYSTWNPEGKWDWWVIGGRWSGYWVVRVEAWAEVLGAEMHTDNWNGVEPVRTDMARLKVIAPESLEPGFALLDLDGVWHERGEMGWLASVSHDVGDAAWRATYRSVLAALPPDTWLVNVDCHV